MKELTKLVGELEHEELVRMRQHLQSGHMLEQIEDRIFALENPNRVCPVCNASIDPKISFTLYFGPRGLRQRASFDGEDCLRHFVNNNV